MRSSSRTGSTIGPKLQSRMRLPPSVTKGSPAVREAQPHRCAQSLDGRPTWLQPERYDLDGHRHACAQKVYQFCAIDDDARRRLAAATIFSRSKAPPKPLIRLSEQRST